MIRSHQITVLTVGSTGDLYPYCALALGLQQAGHRVKVATNANFAAFVCGLGLEFASIAGDYRVLLSSELGQKHLQGEFVKLIDDDLLKQQMSDALDAAQGTEVFIFNQIALWGYHVAERLGVPSFLASTFPLSATQQFPFLSFSEDPNANLFTGWLNYASYFVAEFFSTWQNHTVINSMRETWGLSPLSPLGARFRLDPPRYPSPLPILYGISPSLIDRPQDWDHSIHVTGAWFLDRSTTYEPPTALTEFLADGEPPICIGFGSMIDANPDALTQIVLDALWMQSKTQRAIVLAGWNKFGTIDLPEHLKQQILVIDSVPHSWLFPQVKAVVHHGGSGTTAAVCRAGLPSVVVPYFADQMGWAARLHQLGVSPEPIPRQQLTAESLASAMTIATHDLVMQQKAAQLGRKMSRENGAEQAVSLIHEYLGLSQIEPPR